MNIRSARRGHCPALARLHSEEIYTGFIAGLGLPFLTRLYEGIVDSRYGLLLVALSEKGEILGFVSAARSTRLFYLDFLMGLNGLRAAGAVIRTLSFPGRAPSRGRKGASFLAKCRETLCYPFGREAPGGPEAELLSIVVRGQVRGSSVAGGLVEGLKERFRTGGVGRFKVVVGAENARACRFYEKCGAGLLTKIEVHRGEASNVYVLDTCQENI